MCRVELLHPSILQAVQLRGPEAAKAQQIAVALRNNFTAEQKEKQQGGHGELASHAQIMRANEQGFKGHQPTLAQTIDRLSA